MNESEVKNLLLSSWS